MSFGMLCFFIKIIFLSQMMMICFVLGSLIIASGIYLQLSINAKPCLQQRNCQQLTASIVRAPFCERFKQASYFQTLTDFLFLQKKNEPSQSTNIMHAIGLTIALSNPNRLYSCYHANVVNKIKPSFITSL